VRVCLVCAYSEGLFGKATGGAERQVALLARTLVERGHKVTVDAWEHEGEDCDADGVAVRSAWDPARGVHWVRAVYRASSLRRVLLEVGADLYYTRGASAYSGIVMRAAHTLDAPALLGLASDRDLTADSGRTIAELGDSLPERALSWLIWRALQRRALFAADVVVAQNDAQATSCVRLRLPHVIIPSIVESPPPDLLACEAAWDVVWAGNVTGRGRRKGVAELLSVAESLPGLRFAVMGGLTDLTVAAELARLERLPNVELLGMLGYQDAQRCLASARLVMNTSPTEGFSNVMLEGWALAKPAVTLAVNPNGLLLDRRWPENRATAGRSYLGACATGDVALLARLVVDAVSDDLRLNEIGRQCREYVTTNHAGNAVGLRFEDLSAVAHP
jgi:glycosyltransferase involved in cell wall biosynthesis